MSKYKEALSLVFYSCDLDERLTIKEYFIRLMLQLWEEEESFSGKRPFGNSGWTNDLYTILVYNDYVEGVVTIEDGDGEEYEDSYLVLESVNYKQADLFILTMIKEI